MAHSVFSFADFVDYLRAELRSRQANNTHYSQRAFARDLGLRSSRLNEILTRKLGLSVAAAELVAHRLKLNDKEMVYFRNLVQVRHARSKRKRNEAKRELARQQKDPAALREHFLRKPQ